MYDILGIVGQLKRPRLLVQAARFGLDDYNRGLVLPRLLRTLAVPRSGDAIMKLLDLEASIDETRRDGVAEYSVARHVEIMIALLGEARLLREAIRAQTIAPRVPPAIT